MTLDPGTALAVELGVLAMPGRGEPLRLEPTGRLVGNEGPVTVRAGIVLLDHEADVDEQFALRLAADRAAYSNRYGGERRTEAISKVLDGLRGVVALPIGKRTFADGDEWFDTHHDYRSQTIAYGALRPVERAITLQVGGSGTHALRFLLAGARLAILVSPVLEELEVADAAARELGVRGRLALVLGRAESLPIRSHSIERAIAAGVLHHTDTEVVATEIERILAPSGVFAGYDPWRSAIYDAGIRRFGKMEAGVDCVPLDDDRVAPFAPQAEVTRTGTLVRYPVALAARSGHTVSGRLRRLLFRVDDVVGRVKPLRERLAGGVVVIVRSPPT